MKKEAKKRLERAGWAVGDTSDFLGLSAGEEAFVAASALAATVFPFVLAAIT